LVKATITSKDRGVAKAFQNIKKLDSVDVLVGIPESGAAREGGGMTNAQLAFLNTHGVRKSSMISEMDSTGQPYGAAYDMYLHSHGSPAMRIPPRPIIEPAIEAADNKEAISLELKAAGMELLNGHRDGFLNHLKLAGMTAQNAVRAWFTDSRNNWAANAPATVKKKGSDKPLINTGQLRKSITYVVRET
jgi:hypothetical protein